MTKIQENNSALPFGHFAPTAFEKKLIEVTKLCPTHWLGKRFAFLLRKIALKLSVRAPRDVDVLGAKMRLMPFDNVAEKRLLFTPQYFDKIERDILLQAVQDKGEGFVFVDIGANVGGYSLFVGAHAGAGAKILCFEPQPEMFARLSFNIRQNPFGTIKAFECALADQEGRMRLFLAPSNRGEASLKVLSADPEQGHCVDVQVRTLQSVLVEEQIKAVDALKIDIEGAEDLVLVSFFDHAPKAMWPKLMILENGEGRWQTNLIEYLQGKGYALKQQTRLNYVLSLV